MKSNPAPRVAMMMARGTSWVGRLASSDSVETASKPRKDRHSTAAPAKTTPRPEAVPSPRNGAAMSTPPVPVRVTIAIARKVTMKTVCTAMMTKLARATDTMPTMLSTVTIATDTTMKTHAGIAGNAASR